MPFDPNPLYFKMAEIVADNKDSKNLTKIFNEGGTRSSKTWDTYHLLYSICDHNRGKDLDIYIFRDTLVNARELTFKDFQKFIKVTGFDVEYISERSKPEVKIFGNTIYFKGLPEEKEEAYPTDISFFNEMLEMEKTAVEGLIMRCRKLVIGDWNPKFTQHWAFDFEGQPNTNYTRSTYRNNKHLSDVGISIIEAYEPWEPGSYYVENGIIMYEGYPVSDKNQPPPHPTNCSYVNELGEDKKPTADVFRWKVYGLGLRGAMTGLIHPYHKVINEWPEGLAYIFGNDFGFTADPNALVKYGQKGKNIYLELLSYSCMETENVIVDYLDNMDIPKLTPIICDSSDKYVSKDYGVQNMVKGMRNAGYSARKVSKTKNVVYWIGQMNEYTIHIIRNKFYKFAKTEAENYMWKMIHGIEINQPEDGNDHFWNASRYAYMGYNTSAKIWG